MLRNPLRQFLELLPARPQTVGDVVAINGGVATVELPGGAHVHARGTATVGDRVFVRDGLIEGQAPTLAYVESEV